MVIGVARVAGQRVTQRLGSIGQSGAGGRLRLGAPALALTLARAFRDCLIGQGVGELSFNVNTQTYN